MHDPGNTRCIVRTIRLELAGAQRLFEGKLLIHPLINRICLIPVCHDRLIPQHANRSIDNQARVSQFRRIERLRTDSLAVLHKDTVPAVLAASHDEISCHSLLPVRCFPDDNPPSGIRIILQFLFD